MIPVSELKYFPESTLIDIFETLNYWGWHYALGPMPEGWEELPNYRKPWHSEDQPNKCDIIRPHMLEIRRLVPYDKLFRPRRLW